MTLLPPTDDVIRIEQVHKKRGTRQALDGVTFSIAPGRILGLIGPNGAGKTTTIKILLGLLRADSGQVTVLGEDPMRLSIAARQRIGYVAERGHGDHLPNLPVAELLEYHSHFFAAWDQDWCRQLIARTRVAEGRRLYSLSEGERRKIELVLALAHRPDLLILDDPALGLDPRARRDILWATLAAARDDGTTVLFTSHILQDVERVVDDVVLLDHGVVRVQGPLDEVLTRTRRIVVPDAVGEVERLAGEVQRTRHGRDVVAVTTAFTPELLARVRAMHPGAQVEPINLEEIFCAVVADPESEDPEAA